MSNLRVILLVLSATCAMMFIYLTATHSSPKQETLDCSKCECFADDMLSAPYCSVHTSCVLAHFYKIVTEERRCLERGGERCPWNAIEKVCGPMKDCGVTVQVPR